MTPDLTVRLARPEDIEHLAELFDHYRQFYDCPPDYDAAKRWLTINLAEGRSTIFVADTGLELLGFTQLYPALCSVDLVKYFVLYDLFVAEAARRRGVARPGKAWPELFSPPVPLALPVTPMHRWGRRPCLPQEEW